MFQIRYSCTPTTALSQPKPADKGKKHVKKYLIKGRPHMADTRKFAKVANSSFLTVKERKSVLFD